ncbi:FAD/NAD(P) binding domain-containing protein [Alsobacter metallidurans]|uniref:FAD/NAD(P) binding domain-containing protein n=1 Tax=Alsobacter metallidurans TaxID=340221 RepID=A0A917I5D8_9HYPH|nr:FAD/NAD(P)-binding protein [Alsobacter metallidurans]GGH12955.1 FAD/NAD(P) binding domain-containing protein [Alsobacter metallidurans]
MRTVVIIGTGPTAIYTLRSLVRQPRPLTLLLLEAGPQAGVGTPYDPRRNTVEMLANIASVELPPVVETLLAFMRRRPDDTLSAWGLDRGRLGERDFYPRVALGAYFAEQLALLRDEALAAGHDLRVHTNTRVKDVVPIETSIRIVAERDGAPWSCACDKLVIATGHLSVEYPHKALTTLDDDVKNVAILGSSLSAIDLATAMASQRGLFAGARYQAFPEAPPLRITMMSRGGRLPEADFFCPLPTTPADGFAEADVLRLVDASPPGRVLDAVFAAFADMLAASDPDYAEGIGLAGLDADSFADAYFAERDGADPFAWARRNLEEVRRNAKTQHVIAWRYAILRSHEAFAACVPALDEDEMRRFDMGLKRVFVDNYAAVPPRSVERLLALREAGVLHLEKLDPEYRVEREAQGGRVISGGGAAAFDCIFDATGQEAAPDEAFPFPTLRALLFANRDLGDDPGGRAIRVDETFRLVDGPNSMRNVWCCSLPFLLDERPFIQGLTSCAAIGQETAEAILDDFRVGPEPVDVTLGELIAQVAETSPVLMTDGLVLLAPAPQPAKA